MSEKGKLMGDDQTIYIDLMGIGMENGKFLYLPIYDKLIERYGADHIVGSTAHDGILTKYGNKIRKIVDLRELDKQGAGIENAQIYGAVDETLIHRMSQYQHIILQVLGRNRLYTTYLRRITHYYNYLAFWNGFLDDMNVTCFFAESPPHEFHGVLIYYLCKAKGIKTLVFSDTCIRYGYSFVSKSVYGEYEWSRFDYAYHENAYELLNNHFKAVIDTYMDENSDITPAYDSKEANRKADIEARTFRPSFFKRLVFSIIFLGHVVINGKTSKTIRFLERQLNTYDYLNTYGEARKYYNQYKSPFDKDKKFVYVPLHMQPEQTTMPMAGIYENQLLYVKMLSEAIPEDWELYVKEHRGQYQAPWGFPENRDSNYYRELLGIKKVKLIGMDVSTFELEKYCVCVATATGTAGFEAMFRNKQVILFGGIVYQYAPGVYSVRTREECKCAIKIIEKNHEEYVTNKKDMANWLLHLQSISFYKGESVEGFHNDSKLQNAAFGLLVQEMEETI